MSLARQEFTTVGRDMLGRANAGETLSITRIVVGSGVAAAPGDLWPLTELIEHQVDVTITQQIDQGDGVLLVEGSFNSDVATAPFELRELGVMAHIAAEADRLYSVSNVLATLPDGVDPGVPSVHAFKIKVVIDRAANVTVVIGTSGDIMAENIGVETVGPGWFKEKIANTLRFKRAIEGTGIELIEELDTITVATKSLHIDLDLFVDLSNPNEPPLFNNIQTAIDYLMQYRIPSDITATINVSGEVYNITSNIRLDHPDASQIVMVGAPRQTVNVSQTTNVDAGSKMVTVASSAGLVVGQLCCLRGVSVPWCGGSVIMGIAGNQVTLQKLFAGGIDYSVSETIPGILSWYPTVIRGGGFVAPNGVKSFSNFAIDNFGGNICAIINSGQVSNFLGYGTENGFSGLNPILSGEIALFDCTYGMVAFGGQTISMGAGSLFLNGNAGAGANSQNGGTLILGINSLNQTAIVLVVGNDAGITSVANSIASLGNCYYVLNRVGLQASIGTIVVGVSSPIALMQPDLNTTDLVAIDKGFIRYRQNGGRVPTTYLDNDPGEPPYSAIVITPTIQQTPNFR
jgi:hypothetical protein